MDEREYESNKAQAEAQISGWDRIALLESHRRYTNFDRRLDERIEELVERETEGILSIEVERTLRVVLCTGGPHCEVRWPENGNPEVVCYGWFGGNRYERSLTDDEASVLERLIGGDFDEVVKMQEGRDW